jgi:hypothetical protein
LQCLVDSFVKTIKILGNKSSYFRCEQGKTWLETELPVAVQETCTATPTTPEQVVPRKAFEDLTGRGKRKRVSSLFVQTPDAEELRFLQEKIPKRRRLDMP